MSRNRIEITKIIERLELLEDKRGIIISGLYATSEPANRLSDDLEVWWIKINFDVTTTSWDKLERDVWVTASAYNSEGLLLEKRSAGIYADRFMGITSVSIGFSLEQLPEKIRLYPSD